MWARSDWWFGRYGRKSGQNEVPERIFENISRNMIVTEKIIMTNIKEILLQTRFCLGWMC